jgi:hypothetical protein
MSLDFQQVKHQIGQIGERALQRESQLQDLRKHARELFFGNAQNLEVLQEKVRQVVSNFDPSIRCALPRDEVLDTNNPVQLLPKRISVLAADGSQISPDRHAEVQYCLINVGGVYQCLGAPDAPVISVTSKLLYGDELFSPTGTLTEATLALRRDLGERTLLSELASQLPPPIVSFTDGPLELWGGKTEGSEEAAEFQQSLAVYQQVLLKLNELEVATAGYVDKPGANLVVRLLEVFMAPHDVLQNLRTWHPLRGVSDLDIFREVLDFGERSAIFSMQSQSAKTYQGPLALNFFYLNVGRPGHPWLARVEIPEWVAQNEDMLNHLHAVLVHQSRVIGARPYPYLLHRAHETAVVSLQEKMQVSEMIALELRRRGVGVGQQSNKQANKSLPGRKRYGV